MMGNPRLKLFGALIEPFVVMALTQIGERDCPDGP
jgi:hypothetical protein